MQISTKDWLAYIGKMAQISQTAADKMQEWISKNGFADDKAMLDYAYALSTHYGEAIGALSCQMYEATATAQKAMIRAAEPAATPDYGEVANAVRGAKKQSEKIVSSVVGRLVKQVGADTTLKNAGRDGAQFAWIPMGDTCAFCLTLASNGWQYMSEKTLRDGHAEHIHPNCDCQYAVRFDRKSTIEGYDPEKYKRIYDFAEGHSSNEKINSIRRMLSGAGSLTVDQLDFIIKAYEEPNNFFDIDPGSLYSSLINKGFNLSPLGRGSLKGLDYKSGGGYRMNFLGDGYLQYHPNTSSHHDGEYYKFSSGRTGTKRYSMKGEEL